MTNQGKGIPSTEWEFGGSEDPGRVNFR